VEDLVRAKGEHGRWPVDVDELGVPKEDVAIGGCSMGESVKGARIHRFLLNKESVRLSPNLACQLSVFCEQTSEFIHVTLL
jgi:hypothetical protein